MPLLRTTSQVQEIYGERATSMSRITMASASLSISSDSPRWSLYLIGMQLIPDGAAPLGSDQPSEYRSDTGTMRTSAAVGRNLRRLYVVNMSKLEAAWARSKTCRARRTNCAIKKGTPVLWSKAKPKEDLDVCFLRCHSVHMGDCQTAVCNCLSRASQDVSRPHATQTRLPAVDEQVHGRRRPPNQACALEMCEPHRAEDADPCAESHTQERALLRQEGGDDEL